MTDSMYAVMVAIDVKPERKDAFVEASVTGEEPGIFQFQMLVDESNPNRFYFFEILRDENAAKERWETNVFKTWWNTIEEMFDGEIKNIGKTRTIFPSVDGLENQKPGLLNWEMEYVEKNRYSMSKRHRRHEPIVTEKLPRNDPLLHSTA